MRFPELDSIKGLAIIGVIFAHTNFPSRFEPQTTTLIETLHIIFGWCVLAFFFASGFLAKPINTNQELLSFAKKRFQRLIVPCVVFSITYKVLRIMITFTGFFSWEASVPTGVAEAFEFLLFPASPQFYFLPYLFLAACFFALLERFLSREAAAYLLAIALPITYFFSDAAVRPFGPDLVLIPLYAYCYVLGVIFSKKHAFPSKYFIYPLLISFAMFVAGQEPIITLFAYVPLVLWLVLSQLPKLSDAINKTKIGKYSGGIYVWHAPLVLPLVSIVCSKLIGGSPWSVLPILVVTILVSILLTRITERYDFLRFWRF